MLGHGGLPPIIGTLGDRLGLKRVLSFVYGLGSIIGQFVPAIIMHFTVPKSLFAVSAVLYVVLFLIMQTKRHR